MSQAIRNAVDLDEARAAGLATLYPRRLKILVGSASCGIAVGARAVEAAARWRSELLRIGVLMQEAPKFRTRGRR